ncbi:MAG: outer membrane beta-barrel protein [Bacteroidetes bacterium]|nr:outer membrane beta-barrel protein [Bacteroidota bacterium]MBK8658719.1 outer membrane beta-barrel protein [Bacteroidota bacterium]
MIKKLWLVGLLLNGLWIQAQIDKGSVMVGGNAGFQFRKVDKTTTDIQFSVAPNVLYSVIRQLAIGGQFSYAHYYSKRTEPMQTIVTAQNVFSIGPALRANVKTGPKSVFFFHASPSFGINVTRDPTDKDEVYVSVSNISWRFGPGFSFFLNKNTAIELGVYYDGMRNIYSLRQQRNLISKSAPEFSHGLTFAVGFQFYASKKPSPVKPASN